MYVENKTIAPTMLLIKTIEIGVTSFLSIIGLVWVCAKVQMVPTISKIITPIITLSLTLVMVKKLPLVIAKNRPKNSRIEKKICFFEKKWISSFLI